MTEPTDREPECELSLTVEKPVPDLIPDTPENNMRAVLNAPPKHEDE